MHVRPVEAGTSWAADPTGHQRGLQSAAAQRLRGEDQHCFVMLSYLSFLELCPECCAMHGQTGAIVRALVGFVYPSYQSLQAVMTEDMEDDLTWLRYWIVLSVVHLVELVVDPLVDFFPGYLLAKCGFLVWCMAPVQNNGANLIFSQVGNCLFSIVLLCLNIILEFNSTDAFFRLSSHCSRNINL